MHTKSAYSVEQHPLHSAHGLLPGSPRHQPAHQVLKTICSNIWSGTAEDGYNDAQNMLSKWIINKS